MSRPGDEVCPGRVAFVHAGVSLLMVFVNKAVITQMIFSVPVFVMATQLMVTIILLEIAKALNLVKFGDLTMDMCKTTLPMSVLYALQCYCSLCAVNCMSLPMYTAVKHCTIVFAFLLARWTLHKQRPTPMMVLSMGMMVFGLLFAGIADMLFNYWEWMYAVLLIAFQSAFLVHTERLSERGHYSVTELLYATSFNGMALFVMLSMVTDDFDEATRFISELGDLKFWIGLSVMILCGALFSLTLMRSVVLEGALATAGVTVIKALPQMCVGYVLGVYYYYDLVADRYNAAGLLVNAAGALLYASQVINVDKLFGETSTKTVIMNVDPVRIA